MTVSVSLVEEIILNYAALPKQFDGWRRYRIEYESPDAMHDIWEETIYLPSRADAYKLEKYLNGIIKHANKMPNM